MKDPYSNEKYPSVVGIAIIALLLMFALSSCTEAKCSEESSATQGVVIGGALAPQWIANPNPSTKPHLNRQSMKALREMIGDAVGDANAIAKASNNPRKVKELRQALDVKLSIISRILRYYKLAPTASSDQVLYWEMLDNRADVLTESLLVYDVCFQCKPINWKEIKSISRYQAIELKEMDRFCGLVEGCLL